MADGRLRVVQGANTFYLFDNVDEERARAQYMVCVGANQDAELFTVSEGNWQSVAEQFAEQIESGEVEIVDMRKEKPRE